VFRKTGGHFGRHFQVFVEEYIAMGQPHLGDQ
jgi:hypothetical protein